jgi:hypothetical protein
MMIEGANDELPPLPNGERVAGAKRRSGEGAANLAFVILGRSRRAAASADPRMTNAWWVARVTQGARLTGEAR